MRCDYCGALIPLALPCPHRVCTTSLFPRGQVTCVRRWWAPLLEVCLCTPIVDFKFVRRVVCVPSTPTASTASAPRAEHGEPSVPTRAWPWLCIRQA